MTRDLTDASRNLDHVRAAARELAKCIFPVIETEEGSGRRKHIGSAFALRNGNRAAFVTAAHVVAGPTRKTIVVSPTGETVRWPARYGLLVPRRPDIGDANVAYITGTFTESRPLADISLDRVAVDLNVRPDMRFIAIGYPGARTRIMDGNNAIRPVTFTANLISSA